MMKQKKIDIAVIEAAVRSVSSRDDG